MPAGASPFDRPRSSSVDLLIETSVSVKSSVSPPSKKNRNKQFDQSVETSNLVTGNDVRKEEDYVNYQSDLNKTKIPLTGTGKGCCISPSWNSPMRKDKPETSSNSTTFTVAPSVSSSSSSVSPACQVQKCPGSLHDSTISRLIDAVSLDNEQDSCGSISALIGQFESSVNQNTASGLSSQMSNFRCNSAKVLEELRSPPHFHTPSPTKNLLTSPQKGTQKANSVNRETFSPRKISQSDTPTPALISSPQTTELEEVYTILDEEVLSPVSVYNLRKQTVHIQPDFTESTSCLGSTPPKPAQSLRKEHSASWRDVDRRMGESKEVEETEERIYEEVNDLAAALPETEQSASKMYTAPSLNSNCFQCLHHLTHEAVTEVELNVDEDPSETLLTSPRRGRNWEGFVSPTKRHAIYQNHESTPQKQASLFPKPHYAAHSFHADFSKDQSPNNQLAHQQSNNHQQQDNSQPPLRHRFLNRGPSNPGTLRQNSFPMSQRHSEALGNSRDIGIYTQQKSHRGSQMLSRTTIDRPEYSRREREQVGSFCNGLPTQSTTSVNTSRDRGLYSPSSECEAVYSHLDYDCIMSPCSPAKTSQLQGSSPTKVCGLKQFDIHKAPLNKTEQSQPAFKASPLSNLAPLSHLQSAMTDSTGSTPCKSKSLGDLTSEDISCNFQSKYHIISRSFVTPHMRKEKNRCSMGRAAFPSQSCDPLTEQLRRLVSLEGDDGDRESPGSCQINREAESQLSQQQETSVSPVVPRDMDDSPPTLTRRLSSRSQSRVRHINSRARERQQEALKPRSGVVVNCPASISGVILRNKPASQNPPTNRHSTGSYIAGYLGELEDRGLPEGACTSLRNGNMDHYGDRYHTDDSLPPLDSSHSTSEPEVYFLLRL